MFESVNNAIGAEVNIHEPRNKKDLVLSSSENFPAKKLPIIKPSGGNEKYTPICDALISYILDAMYGPPTKKMPKTEKLKEETNVGGQNLFDFNSKG